jgi:hypothetical protein
MAWADQAEDGQSDPDAEVDQMLAEEQAKRKAAKKTTSSGGSAKKQTTVSERGSA